MAVNEDTKDHLNQVKKGKPRKFVLVTKGAEVVGLVVFKQGAAKQYKSEAGQGKFYHGVVEGGGQSLVFSLARSDGFDKEPVKALTLKKFLDEEADFDCRPTIQIVDNPPLLLDKDDPLVARFLKLKDAVAAASEQKPDQAGKLASSVQAIAKILDQNPSSDQAYDLIAALEKELEKLVFGGDKSSAEPTSGDAPPPAPDPAALEFKAKLTAVLKQATPHVAAIGAQIKDMAAEARALADKGQFDGATKKLQEMLALVKQAQAKPEDVDQDQMQQFTERVAEYKSAIDRLKDSGPDAKLKASEAGALIRQAAGLAKKDDFEQAGLLLDQVERLLKQSSGDGKPSLDQDATPEQQSSDADAGAPSSESLQARIAGVEPLYLQTMKRNPADRTRLGATMAMALELIESGAYARAAATIDRLEKLLANPGEPDSAPKMRTTEEPYYNVIGGDGQLVRYRKALLAWDAARKSARNQVAELKSAVAKQAPSLAKSAEMLDGVLERLGNELDDALNAALNAEDLGMRGREHARAGEIARDYLVTVNFDPLFATVDRNPVRPLKLIATLANALSQVVAALPV